MDNVRVRLVPRYSFAVDVEVTDLQSETQIQEKTKDLSLYGCGIDTAKVLATGTKVRIKFTHEGKEISALARVVYARPDLGMGVAFYALEPADERILEAWIADLSPLSAPNV